MSQDHPMTIWYASETRAQSPMKFLVYEDKGSLTIEDGILSFHGKHNGFQLKNIEEIRLARQMANWPVHVAAAAALFFILIKRGHDGRGAALLAACAALAGLTIGFSTPWVKVTYRTDDGQQKSAWFANGGNLGWAGIFGGTRRLCDVIRSNTLDAKEPTEEPVVLGYPVASSSGESVPEECPWCEETVIPDEDRRCPACDRPL